MPQIPPLLPRHNSPARTVDEILRQAFAPILAEKVPFRLSAALSGPLDIGSDNDNDGLCPR
jgi:hypothetical protein